MDKQLWVYDLEVDKQEIYEVLATITIQEHVEENIEILELERYEEDQSEEDDGIKELVVMNLQD